MNTRRTIACLIPLLAITTASHAQSLLGPGQNHLPLPSPFGVAPLHIAPTITTVLGGFTGTWTSPAGANWVGTFSATGVTPSTPPGTTVYDFSTLPTGGLPSGSYMILGDLDGGSGSGETTVLKAFDAAGVQITTAWIEVPSHVTGTPISLQAMPGWSFSGGVYSFDGTTQTGPNPTIGVYLPTNTKLTTLEVVQTGTNHGFAISAPLPCYADCDGDGVLTISDFICFQTMFALGC